MTPIDALHRQAENRPDGVAFISGNEVWSYRRLAGDAGRLALALLARGVQPGDRVALHMANLPQLVIAYYACFRIGAIAAPLNIRFKTVELRPLLARLQPALYLGQAQLYPQVAPIEPEILAPNARFVVGEVDDERAQSWERLLEWGACRSTLPDPELDAPALLLTTSGTTGLPKFVTHTPATLSACTEVYPHSGINAEQVVLNALPMVHGAGLFVLFCSVELGAPVVLLERFDPEAVLDAIAPHHCSWMLGMPFMFAEMMARQRAHRRAVATLRFCVSAGDVCPVELQEAFPAVFGIPLHSLWGTSEAWAFLHGLQVGPVTRIPPGMQVRLVDDDGAPVPRGEVGELLVRGPRVTPGYWKGPDKIDDPKSDGWFPTGDLMRQDEDDNLWFVARKKDLIIRGGSNISPVEVERVLMAHAAVRDVAVVGVPDEVLGQRVAALVQLANGAGPDAFRAILAHAKAQLADYKVPERLKIVSEIPRNLVGKIERKSLPAMMSDDYAGEARSAVTRQITSPTSSATRRA
jgi:acyl-CoA synthetase (AMP-forming)/AMP-acid ligase II